MSTAKGVKLALNEDVNGFSDIKSRKWTKAQAINFDQQVKTRSIGRDSFKPAQTITHDMLFGRLDEAGRKRNRKQVAQTKSNRGAALKEAKTKTSSKFYKQLQTTAEGHAIRTVEHICFEEGKSRPFKLLSYSLLGFVADTIVLTHGDKMFKRNLVLPC